MPLLSSYGILTARGKQRSFHTQFKLEQAANNTYQKSWNYTYSYDNILVAQLLQDPRIWVKSSWQHQIFSQFSNFIIREKKEIPILAPSRKISLRTFSSHLKKKKNHHFPVLVIYFIHEVWLQIILGFFCFNSTASTWDNSLVENIQDMQVQRRNNKQNSWCDSFQENEALERCGH